MPPPLPASVSAGQFASCLARYEPTIAALSSSHSAAPGGRSLADLDEWRRCVLPALARKRGPPHLTKGELSDLLQCKLKRGKFRPLKSLVDSNTDAAVHQATSTAFSLLPDNPAAQAVSAALKEACALRGVGRATASYVLAVYRPADIPIFSDEGYRWAMYEEKPGRGWDRKIKYDVKEYMQYLTATKEIAGRLGVSVEDVEKVGFVLGREAVSKDAAPAPDKKGSSAKVKEEAPPPSKRPRSSEAGEEAEEAVKTRKRVKANEAEKERMPKPASSERTLRSRSLMNPNE